MTEKRLKNLREKVEEIDTKIAKLLAVREKNIIEIGKIKKHLHKPIKNLKIEKEKLEQLDTQYQKEIFKKIFSKSRKIQSEL